MNAPAPKIRVMQVDDSAVVRGLIAKVLETDPAIEIVGVAINGEMAVGNIKRLDPDVVLLDIEMPVMDGITALPLLLKECPDARVLMCSTLSERGADISIKAMTLGAADCILKPSSGAALMNGEDFQGELLRLIHALGEAARRKKNAASMPAPAATVAKAPAGFAPAGVPPADAHKFSLRPGAPAVPKIFAIGSSTGGPNALMAVLKDLKGLPVPIVITQHMPKTFTAILAKHIEQQCGIPCVEGAEGMALEAGKAYVAPGGLHMLIRGDATKPVIHLDDGAPENFCKPAVDPMLRSLIPIYGNRVLTMILTGMGSDGALGGGEIVKAGGRVIAQDEATSVVWGMPGAAAMAGICTAVLPLDGLSFWVKNAFAGKV